MSIALLRHTPIRRKLLTLALAAGLAFVTVSVLFILSWRDLEKVSSRVSSTYIPTLRDGAAALVSVSSLGTELFRYVNHIEPSAYRVGDALEGARAALQRIAGSDIPPEIRANIESLLPQVAAHEAGLSRLTARVERDDVLGVGEEHTRMAAEAGLMLRGVERINGQLLDSIVQENRAGARNSLERAAAAAGLSLLCILAALLYMGLVRRDLETGLAQLREAVQRYAGGESAAITPLDRKDEVGQLSRYLNQLSAQIKEIEAQLRERLKFINDVFDSVPLSLAFRDMEGRFRLVNRTWEQYFGFTREQTLGKTPADLAAMPGGTDSSEVARIAAEDQRALGLGPGKSTEPREVVLRGRHRLHSRYYLQSRTAMGDAQGNLTGVLVAGLDTTDQHELQQVLETQQQRLELVVRAEKVGIIDWDGVTHKGWYSDRMKEILGYPAHADMSAWVFFDAVHPEDTERVRAMLVATLKGKTGADALEAEYRLCRADGAYVWVHTTGLALRGADGRSTRFLSSISDISERRAQEEALRTQEQRLALVVRAAQVGIIDWDAATRTAWHSARFKTLLGHAPDTDSSGWPDVFDLIHAEDRPRVYAAHIDHLKHRGVPGGESPHDALEYRLRCADGSYRWVQGIGLSLCDASGRATRFIAAITDISERRAQEQALRDQMQLTRDLIDRNPNPVFLKDEQCRFVEINRAYSTLTRITSEQAIGRTVFDLYPEKDALIYDQQDRELLARGEGENSVEVDVVLGDGKRHYFLMNKSVLRRADGMVRGMVCTLTDVTTLKEADAKVRDQMQLTRDLIRALPNPLFLKDEQFRFVHVNPAWEKVAACPAEKAIGRLIPEVYPPEYAEEFLAQDRALLAQGNGVQSIEVSIPGRKGPRQYILSKSLLRREDGSLRGMIGSMTDITRLKRAEAQLRESEERMRFWLENIPIPIAIYDPQGGVQFLNSAFIATFGWTLEEMRGKRMPFVPEHRKLELEGVLHRLLTAGKDAFETERLTKDGRTLEIDISTGMARAPDGTPRATMVSLTDVTERKRMERDLRASRDAALQAEQAKSAFLAAMSHEIRTPLNGVLGMAGLLADTELTPEQRDYAETIRVSGDALLSVINDILDYSKIESGHMELEDEPLETARVVEESLEILGERARAKRLELIAEIDDAVPAWVRGDFARLRQILVNLVGNAVKFTERGEIVVRARVAGEGRLRFEVSDTGIGIAQDRLPKLFEAFTQADASTTRKYGGTGLGLAISRRLVDLMGGSLAAESAPGRGSTFSVEIRAERSAAPAGAARAAQPVELAGCRVLIVDDNATNLRILQKQLERWGAVPVAAASPAAALQRLSAGERFDAALLDYHMPGMDGVMLARRIRAVVKEKLPLVLLSSSMYRRAEEAEAGLFTVQLLKPVRQHHLREALATALGGVPAAALRRGRKAKVTRKAAKSSGIRVLVVDDIEVNRRLAQALLRKLGHASDAAGSGQEAIEMAQARRYDLILMDVEMPDVDGMEASRRIRERLGAAAPRIVAMTANAMPGDRERYLASGMDGYVAKPIDPQALAEQAVAAPRSPAAAVRAASRVEPAATLLDLSRLQELLEYDDGEHSMVRGVIDAFLDACPRHLAAVREAHARADREALARSAHAVRGAASNVGAASLSRAAARIETLAREGPGANLGTLVAELDSVYERCAAALGLERDRLAKRVSR